MTPAQITFTLPDITLKKQFLEKAKSQGVSMKTILLSLIKDYVENPYEIKAVKQEEWRDDMMTEENKKNYIQAKKDFDNGVNIVSQEEIYAKYL